ncbi:MAG: glycosyltransferase [Miltoncostaeaceae bacterium]
MSLAGRLLVPLALAAGAVYLGWRWGFTLDGASMWLGIPLALAETYALLMLALLAHSCWALSDRPRPDPLPGRRVAILIATYNEDEEVLRPTVLGALRVRQDPAPEVWVLDDGDREWVARMCAELGARHLVRPVPRLHAKAGNLNHALTHVDAEFVVTLDADHVPRPELLERMLGYFADERVAVVQAPQTFYNRGFQHSPGVVDPLRHDQSVFFDAVCRGKDRHDAAFWCGCPSVLRRSALMEVGGVRTDTVVEDFHTSIHLQARGWRTVYHPEVMALGLAPEEIGAYVVQRGRWARGCLEVLARDLPLRRRGLTMNQRVEYTTSCVHFLEGFQRLVLFLVPPLVLVTGLVPVAAGPLVYALIFAPQLLLTPLASKALTRGRYRMLETERYSIVRMEAYVAALAAFIPGRRSAFTVTPKGARDDRAILARALRLPVAVAALTAGALAYQGAAQALSLPGELGVGALVVTALWAVANLVLIALVITWARSVRHRRRSHRFPVRLEATMGVGDQEPGWPAHVRDLSASGARLVAGGTHRTGERVTLVLLLAEGAVRVRGTVAAVWPAAGEGTSVLGVEFDRVETGAQDAIVAWCLRYPFGPDLPIGPPEPERIDASREPVASG